MHTLRGFDWLFYEDGTDNGEYLIKNIEIDSTKKTVVLEAQSGNIAPIIAALQENSVIYVQADTGLYRIEYSCSFRNLDAAFFPAHKRRVSLGLVVLTFLPGVTTHDKIIN